MSRAAAISVRRYFARASALILSDVVRSAVVISAIAYGGRQLDPSAERDRHE
jgi:hypothetical protein